MSIPAFLTNPQGLHGSEGWEKLQAQPQAALTTGSSWVGLKCARQEELICIPQTSLPLTRKIKKKKIPVCKKQMGSMNSEGTRAEGKRGEKGIKSHSKPIPSGECCSWSQPLLLSAPLPSLPWHRSSIPAWAGQPLLSQAHRRAKGLGHWWGGRKSQKNGPRKEAPLPAASLKTLARLEGD